MTSKSAIQADQYRFPYHYLVDLQEEDFVRNVDWGLDYLTYMRKVVDLVRSYLRKDVLDVGCGDGFLLHHLARNTDLLEHRRAVGIDIDGKAIRFAQAFSYDLKDVTFVERDLAAYNETFELITSVETLEHIPDDHLEAFVANMDRLLLPGGHLIVSVPSTVRPVIEKHFRHYDIELLKATFSTYDVVEVHYVTARRNVFYKIAAKLLANRYLNFNYGPFKKALLGFHNRFTSDVSERNGAHIVAVFRKT